MYLQVSEYSKLDWISNSNSDFSIRTAIHYFIVLPFNGYINLFILISVTKSGL